MFLAMLFVFVDLGFCGLYDWLLLVVDWWMICFLGGFGRIDCGFCFVL